MGIIEIVAIIILVMWLGGFALNIGGNFIHILLIIALIVFLSRFFRGKV
jgi:hypothetical protein